jgi:hypothetical protein
VSYKVFITEIAKSHLRELASSEPEVARAALKVALELRNDPYLGEEMRARPRLAALPDRRRIRFDREGWRGKPRYRLVYRNEPSDRAPHVVAVLAVGVRERLSAYRAAARARAERLRELGG